MLVQIAKVLLLVFWAAFIFSFIRPFAGVMQSILLWLGILLVVVHAVEFAIKRGDLDAIDAGGVSGFVQTMLFGIAYWGPALKSANTSAADQDPEG